MFERYTEEARRALLFSRLEATRLGATAIDTGHLLLGLLRAETSAALLQRHGVRLDDVRAILARRAQEPIVFTVEASPDPELVFTGYDPAVHSAFAFILTQPPLAGTAGHVAVLTNLSSRRITALVARWTVIDPVGDVRTTHVAQDDYFSTRHSLDAGAQVLATPDGFHKAISGPYFVISSGSSRLDHDVAATVVDAAAAAEEHQRRSSRSPAARLAHRSAERGGGSRPQTAHKTEPPHVLTQVVAAAEALSRSCLPSAARRYTPVSVITA